MTVGNSEFRTKGKHGALNAILGKTVGVMGNCFRGMNLTMVVRLNIHRRHLTASQKGAIAYEAKRLFEEEAKERRIEGNRRVAETTNAMRSVATLPPSVEEPEWPSDEDASPTPTPAWLKQPETASAPA